MSVNVDYDRFLQNHFQFVTDQPFVIRCCIVRAIETSLNNLEIDKTWIDFKIIVRCCLWVLSPPQEELLRMKVLFYFFLTSPNNDFSLRGILHSRKITLGNYLLRSSAGCLVSLKATVKRSFCCNREWNLSLLSSFLQLGRCTDWMK
jgi:hypothetical protein